MNYSFPGCDVRREARTQGAFILIEIWARPRTTPHAVQRGPETPGFIMKRVLKRLQENLGSKLRPATAARDEIDGLVKIGSAVSNPLGKRKRIPGLDEDV